MIRKNLAGLVQRADSAHLGLLMAKGFSATPQADGPDTDKAQHIESIVQKGNAQARKTSGYKAAFDYWKAVLNQLPNTESFGMALNSALFIGNSRDNALETNCTFHHVHGVPLIPGSSIRGMLRHYLIDMGMGAEQLRFLFGSEASESPKLDHLTTQGHADAYARRHAGVLVFHDALWVPESKHGPLCFDILTPHHGDYYQQEGRVQASDFDVPVPVPQLGVQGDFWFAFSCAHEGWRKLVKDLLVDALQKSGVGSKTTLGYGLFTTEGLYKEAEDEKKTAALAVVRTFKVRGDRNRLVAIDAEVEGEVHKILEVKRESAQQFFDSLGKSQKKKLGDKSLEVTAKVEKIGKRFMLIDLVLVPTDIPPA